MSTCYKCGEQWTNENKIETPLLCPKCELKMSIVEVLKALDYYEQNVPQTPAWLRDENKCEVSLGALRKLKQAANERGHLLESESSLAAPTGLDDAINGLKHMADDHKCCEPFIVATISKLEQLREAVNTAIWIRDRIQDKGGFGAGFAEWRDIEAAVAPNAELSESARERQKP